MTYFIALMGDKSHVKKKLSNLPQILLRLTEQMGFFWKPPASLLFPRRFTLETLLLQKNNAFSASLRWTSSVPKNIFLGDLALIFSKI